MVDADFSDGRTDDQIISADAYLCGLVASSTRSSCYTAATAETTELYLLGVYCLLASREERNTHSAAETVRIHDNNLILVTS